MEKKKKKRRRKIFNLIIDDGNFILMLELFIYNFLEDTLLD
jgi:hypothetical protein